MPFLSGSQWRRPLLLCGNCFMCNIYIYIYIYKMYGFNLLCVTPMDLFVCFLPSCVHWPRLYPKSLPITSFTIPYISPLIQFTWRSEWKRIECTSVVHSFLRCIVGLNECTRERPLWFRTPLKMAVASNSAQFEGIGGDFGYNPSFSLPLIVSFCSPVLS